MQQTVNGIIKVFNPWLSQFYSSKRVNHAWLGAANMHPHTCKCWFSVSWNWSMKTHFFVVINSKRVTQKMCWFGIIQIQSKLGKLFSCISILKRNYWVIWLTIFKVFENLDQVSKSSDTKLIGFYTEVDKTVCPITIVWFEISNVYFLLLIFFVFIRQIF